MKEPIEKTKKKKNMNRIRRNIDDFMNYISTKENVNIVDLYNKIKMLNKQSLKSLHSPSLRREFLNNVNLKIKPPVDNGTCKIQNKQQLQQHE